MKNTFSVTIKMTSAEQLAGFINDIGSLVDSVTITTTPVERPASAPKPVHTRPARGSKVNDTILSTLGQGQASVRELKEALEARNLSAGSLSTGIAALTKAGHIERVSEGVYALTGGYSQAAE
jgi:hypothetical protein